MPRKKKPKLCDDCKSKPATAKMRLKGLEITTDGVTRSLNLTKTELCDACTTKSMQAFTKWLTDQRETA